MNYAGELDKRWVIAYLYTRYKRAGMYSLPYVPVRLRLYSGGAAGFDPAKAFPTEARGSIGYRVSGHRPSATPDFPKS